MSARFDSLKRTFEAFYPEYKFWVEENYAKFPSEKIGNGAFTMQEANTLLYEFSETMDIVLKDKERYLEYASEFELNSICTGLFGMLDAAKNGVSSGDYTDFANRINGLIPHIRRFQFIQVENTYEKLGRLKNVLDYANNQERQINDHANQINDAFVRISKQKPTIDELVNLIQECEGKLKNFSIEHQEKLKYFSEKYELSMNEVESLIKKSHEALNLSTANKLSGAFNARQKKLGGIVVKGGWLLGGGLAVAAAVWIGYTFFDKDTDVYFIDNIENVVLRTLLMTISIGVAVFCSKQYARNRVLEEDYAYKVALAASFPGLDEAFEQAGLRQDYARKLLEEILQDPQRARHHKESLVDNHLLMAELKKFLKSVANKKDE